jgi:hypothetical protein
MIWKKKVNKDGKMIDDSFLQDKPQEMKDQLDMIIDQLKRSGLKYNAQDLEAMIILWLKSIIERFADMGEEIDFNKLTADEKAKIMKEIESLVAKLKKSGVAVGSDQIQKLLIEGLFVVLKKFQKKQKKEYEYEFLTEKDKKNIKAQLIRWAIYELYKIINPRQLAGETKMENFINNVLVGGIEYAKEYSGGSPEEIKSYGFDSGFLKELEKSHKSHLKDPSELHEYYGDYSKSPPSKGGRVL